jgi:DNA-binding CsgD family transcriptional regulator
MPTYSNTVRLARRSRSARPLAFATGQQIRDRDWYRHPVVATMYRPMGIDQMLGSVHGLPDGGRFSALAVQRAWGDRRPFGDRDRQSLQFVHESLAWLLDRPRPNSTTIRLSPRQREVLSGLLAGDSVKQVALRLGISRFTTQDHVSDLYRIYQVHSRGELLARFVSP